MAQGKVTINNLNLAQGATPEIERKALFVGPGTLNAGEVLTVNSQTDLDEVFDGEEDFLKAQVLAAQRNGGENWTAYVAPKIEEQSWQSIVDNAMLTVSPELIVLCDPIQDNEEINGMQPYAEKLRTQLGRRVIMLVAANGIQSEMTWAQYEARMANLTTGIVAGRLGVVPLLHGNDIGVLAGRLCNRAASIADTPMRTATGTVIGLGPTPMDSNEIPLRSSTLQFLDSHRFSCVQTYPDYPGIYWGDCNLLDVPGGDYQVIENLRVVDKAARAIRLLAIARIGNRALNSTPISIASNKTYFLRPLREMAQTTVFNGETFPGEILPPKDDAVEIVWTGNDKVEIYLKVQPYNAPKEIVANLILDLNAGV